MDYPNQEYLVSNAYATVIISVTSRCNLRCIYCGVSQPTYQGQDMDLSCLADLVTQMKKAGVQSVNFNGHGETTMIDGWHMYCRDLIEAGFSVGITSNFGRDFEKEELDVLSRLSWIQVSCDTVDRPLFRELRRHADLNKLLANMVKVRAAAIADGRTPPAFGWTCVVNDRVVDGLENWFWVGVANGVSSFTLSNYVKMPDLEGVKNVVHLADLPHAGRQQAIANIESFVDLAKKNGKGYELQGDLLELLKHGITENANEDRAVEAATVGSGGFQKRIHSVVPSPGETRDCIDPWSFAMIFPDGKVLPCCWWYGGEAIGDLKEKSFEVIANDVPIQKLRSELLTGKLSANCRNCPSRKITTIEHLRSLITARVDQAALIAKEEAIRNQQSELAAACESAFKRLELDDIDAAIDTFSEVLRNSPDFGPAKHGVKAAAERLTMQGEQAFADGDAVAAEAKFSAATHLDPGNVRTLNDLGVLAWNSGNLEVALQRFASAFALNPADPNCVNNLCDGLMAVNRYKDAKGVLLSYMAHCPEDQVIFNKFLTIPDEK